MYPTEKDDFEGLSKLKNDIELYFYYSELIRKNRSEEARKRVEAVIKQVPTFIARIREIETIDREDEEKHPEIERVKTLKERKVVTAIEEAEIEKRKLEKPKKLRVSGFINFLFSERHKLIQYTGRNNYVMGKFFGFIFKLSPEFFSDLKDLCNEVIGRTLPACEFLVDISWRFVDKLQYNLIQVFYNFIKGFEGLSRIKNGTGIHEIMNIINNVSPYYLELLYNDKNTNILIEGMQVTLMRSKEFSGSLPQIVDFLYRSFSKRDLNKKNFSQLLLAVYSVYYKKAIKLENFLNIIQPSL